MAHLVNSMAYKGDIPWHGLGNALPANQSIETWATQAGMDWDILSSPVNFMTQPSDLDHSPSALTPVNAHNTHKNYPERQVLYRSDTHTPLSVVSDRYQIVQPREILEFYRDLTEQAGFELETAGVLKGGRKLWALARTGQSSHLRGNDVTNGYVLLATACDGTMATTAQFTSIRVVCNNTLAIALGSGQDHVRMPHSTRFKPDQVKQQLGINLSAWDNFMYGMKQLSERTVSDREAKQFLTQVFNPASLTHSDSMLPSRASQKALTLFEGHGRGAQLASAKGTAYGLLNSVTEFIDHERRAKSADHRLDAAWFGQGAVIKRRALDHAMALMA